MLRSIGKQSGESMDSVGKKKRYATVGRICRKGKVLSLEWKNEGVMDDESGELMELMYKCHSKNWVMQNWRD